MGDCTICCRMFSSIPCFYPLNSNSIPPLIFLTAKNVSNHCKIASCWEPPMKRKFDVKATGVVHWGVSHFRWEHGEGGGARKNEMGVGPDIKEHQIPNLACKLSRKPQKAGGGFYSRRQDWFCYFGGQREVFVLTLHHVGNTSGSWTTGRSLWGLVSWAVRQMVRLGPEAVAVEMGRRLVKPVSTFGWVRIFHWCVDRRTDTSLEWWTSKTFLWFWKHLCVLRFTIFTGNGTLF